jgi:hypothetical protein
MCAWEGCTTGTIELPNPNQPSVAKTSGFLHPYIYRYIGTPRGVTPGETILALEGEGITWMGQRSRQGIALFSVRTEFWRSTRARVPPGRRLCANCARMLLLHRYSAHWSRHQSVSGCRCHFVGSTVELFEGIGPRAYKSEFEIMKLGIVNGQTFPAKHDRPRHRRCLGNPPSYLSATAARSVGVDQKEGHHISATCPKDESSR